MEDQQVFLDQDTRYARQMQPSAASLHQVVEFYRSGEIELIINIICLIPYISQFLGGASSIFWKEGPRNESLLALETLKPRWLSEGA